MKKLALFFVPVLIALLVPNQGTAKVVVGGKEIKSTVSRSGGFTGGSRDIFYQPYSNVQAPSSAAQSTAAPAGFMSYTVKPGDTLSQIALSYLGNADMAYLLAAYNGISNPNQIHVGQNILVPIPKIGLQYKIEIMRPVAGGCEIAEVNDNYAFRSGDKFRLRLRSNVNGYVYIFNEGTSQRKYMIFPDPRISGGQNYLTAFREYTVPSAGWFQFDNQPGTERMIFVQSLKPIQQFGAFMGSGYMNVPAGQIFALPLTQPQWQVVSNRLQKVKKASRDIVLAYDQGPTDTVNPNVPQSGFILQTMSQPDDLFLAEILLIHR